MLFSWGRAVKKREGVLDKLTRFLERFFDISGGVFNKNNNQCAVLDGNLGLNMLI